MRLLLLIVCWLGVCPVAWAKPLTVAVSMPPLARVVHTVVPPADVEISILLTPGTTPHDATLRPGQLRALMDADLALWWGPDIEPHLAGWMQKRRGLTVTVSDHASMVRLPPRAAAAQHDHHGHEHALDIHVWWSRANLALAGDILAKTFQTHFPEQTLNDRRTADAGVAPLLEMLRRTPPRYAVFHDGWQYLERDIGVKSQEQLIAHDELGAGLRHLAGMQERFRRESLDCVLVEPGMNLALLDKLLPKVKKLQLDPMGWDAPGNDVEALLRHAYETLAACH